MLRTSSVMSDNEEMVRMGRPPLPTAADLNLPLPVAEGASEDVLTKAAMDAVAADEFDPTVAVGQPFAVDHTVDIASAFAAAAASFMRTASSSSSAKPNLKPSEAKQSEAKQSEAKQSEAKKVKKTVTFKIPLQTFHYLPSDSEPVH